MPQIRCPVLGCGKRKDEWRGRKAGYPPPSSNVFTLLLSTDVDVSLNNRICETCNKRHRLHSPGGDSLLDSLPQHRTRLISYQPIEHSTRLLCFDELLVDGAGMLNGIAHCVARDLVKEHSAHGRAASALDL